MPERARSIVSRLRHLIGNRRFAKRVEVSLPCRVSLARAADQNGTRPIRTLGGTTADISTSGLALLVPAIRIDEHYLVGDDRKLEVKLDLPSGTIEVQVIPVRYERLPENSSGSNYLIGAQIATMPERDRDLYGKFIQSLLHRAPGD